MRRAGGPRGLMASHCGWAPVVTVADARGVSAPVAAEIEYPTISFE